MHQRQRRPHNARPPLPTMGRNCLLDAPSFERRHDFTRTGEAFLRATCETPQNRRFPKRIHVRDMDTRTRRRLVQAFDRHLQRGLPHKGQRPGHHLVKHDAERVDIRGGRDRTALNLLGGHVSRRTRYLVLRRQRHRQVGALILRAPPRQTEIRDDGAHLFFRASRLHEHDVVALEVPVHDPNAVRGRQAGGHLTNDRQDLRRGEPSVPPELVGKRLAVQQLHREHHDLAGRPVTRSRVSVPEDIVDTTDVRVRHLSRQVHLALEQQDRTLVSRDVRQDGLERDPLAQFEILRLVELAHAAFRKVADDAEAERDDVASSKHRGPRCPSLNHSERRSRRHRAGPSGAAGGTAWSWR